MPPNYKIQWHLLRFSIVDLSSLISNFFLGDLEKSSEFGQCSGKSFVKVPVGKNKA
jgi:hypothetical protein